MWSILICIVISTEWITLQNGVHSDFRNGVRRKNRFFCCLFIIERCLLVFDTNFAIIVHIPSASRKELAQFLERVTALVPGLNAVDVDVPLSSLMRENSKLEQVALGREFHISLGRTVPVRVHQINSIVSMFRQRLHSQKRYWINFDKWEIFVNDDCTRTFLSLEVVKGGLSEITKQIQAVNEVYRLHNLPEFYKDPRPHISTAWALGDISDTLKSMVEEEMKRYLVGSSQQMPIFTTKFSSILCKIGNKSYEICKYLGE
nr:U6 snRNA phosphodiesterase [Ipomoea batatas]